MSEAVEQDEIQLSEVLKLFLVYWRTVAITTLTSLLVAAVAYAFVPRAYQLVVDIHPARQADLAPYTALAAADAFPYKQDELFKEYASYIQDYTLLVEAIAKVEGEKPKIDEQQKLYQENIIGRGIKFTSSSRDPNTLTMAVRGESQEFVNALARQVLASANEKFADSISMEINKIADALEGDVQIKKSKIEDEIDARRKTQESIDEDLIVKFSEQADIARVAGIEKPFRIRNGADNTTADSGDTALSVDIVSPSIEPTYLSGYVALDEAIKQLRLRKGNDAYVPNLRYLERQVLQLDSDKRAGRIRQLLAQSGLAKAENSPLVRYELRSNQIIKVFPRASIFGSAAIFLGLALGAIIIYARERISR